MATTRRVLAIVALPLAGSCVAQGQETSNGFTCEEGFVNVATLSARGWILQNNSEALGSCRWGQGDPDLFAAWSGVADSYAMVGADSASGAFPVVSNWLITPEIDFGPNEFNAHGFGFHTRAAPGYANRVVVRLCVGQTVSDCTAPGPASGDLGGFQTTLLDINPSLTPDGYPIDWTAYWLAPGDGLPVVGHGRIAFHYYVFSQPDGSHGSAIGIDSVSMAGSTGCPFDVVFESEFE